MNISSRSFGKPKKLSKHFSTTSFTSAAVRFSLRNDFWKDRWCANSKLSLDNSTYCSSESTLCTLLLNALHFTLTEYHSFHPVNTRQSKIFRKCWHSYFYLNKIQILTKQNKTKINKKPNKNKKVRPQTTMLKCWPPAPTCPPSYCGAGD